ncbi:MAG: Response regulator receiver protein [Verrucomicrobiales bacterium]|nr:Response regulator receiver protein [Verrucomicrobiales bacterium]
MAKRPKILLLDDEQDLLDLYQEILSQLPQQPEITLCNSGARALALLEGEPYQLMISDLRMPKIDGLQVLSIVRRKLPELRIIIMTSMVDEQYRSRAYAMGVDLFWEKPNTPDEIKMFQDCVAGFLDRDEKAGGFRGMQSKSLVDLVQLECLSKNSSLLRIINGALEGKIWIQEGDIVDAKAGELEGEPAFKEIFSWRNGNFEIYPPDSARTRTIHASHHALLLDTAQAMDEADNEAEEKRTEALAKAATSSLSPYASFEGVDFALTVTLDKKVESWGVDHPSAMGEWILETEKHLSALGEKLAVGDLNLVTGQGLQNRVAVARGQTAHLCIGFKRALDNEQVGDTMKQIQSKWAS